MEIYGEYDEVQMPTNTNVSNSNAGMTLVRNIKICHISVWTFVPNITPAEQDCTLGVFLQKMEEAR